MWFNDRVIPNPRKLVICKDGVHADRIIASFTLDINDYYFCQPMYTLGGRQFDRVVVFAGVPLLAESRLEYIQMQRWIEERVTLTLSSSSSRIIYI